MAVNDEGNKKRRSDFGQIIMTERDEQCFRWIGHQYAICLDHLQILLGRLSNRQNLKADNKLTMAGVRRVYTRWLKAGWVEKRKLVTKYDQWIWLTRLGLRELGIEYRYYVPSISKLHHIYWSNAVRLYIEKRIGYPNQITSERALYKREYERGKGDHVADFEVLYKGATVAVEVELTQKSKNHIDEILRFLESNYRTTWYFVPDELEDFVRKAITKVDKKNHAFAVFNLDKITDEL